MGSFRLKNVSRSLLVLCDVLNSLTLAENYSSDVDQTEVQMRHHQTISRSLRISISNRFVENG